MHLYADSCAVARITGLSPEVSGDDKGTWLAPVIQTTLSLKASLDRRRDPSSFRSASALNANAYFLVPTRHVSSRQALSCASIQDKSGPVRAGMLQHTA